MPDAAIFAVNMVSMVFNGLSASWMSFAGPVLSEQWFPPSQRATVTALLSVAPYIGMSLGFVVGPLVVPDGARGADKLDLMLLSEAAIATTIFVSMLV
jgi:MFS family permease